MVVSPTMPELYLIFEYIKTNYSVEEIAELKRRLLDHVDRAGKSQSTQEKLHIHCSFLVDGNCSIHDVKPLSCRAYTSTDVEKCKEYVDNPTISVPNSICHYLPFDITRKGIMKSLYIAGFKDVTEELNQGILRLLDGHQELEEIDQFLSDQIKP